MSWLLLLAAAPVFVVEGDLPDELGDRAALHWRAIAEGCSLADTTETPVRIRRGRLASSHNGRSLLGVIELRETPRGELTRRQDTALRHEIAHQFLLANCPASARDRLFHEAFAMWASGEAKQWRTGPYQSVAKAAATVAAAKSVDRPSVRRAIARLLAEASPSGRTLKARLRHCDRAWPGPMSTEELTGELEYPTANAHVVLSRHSGIVLNSGGAAALPQPFGSTLKPFVVSGQPTAPTLPVDPKRWGWSGCGEGAVNATNALLRSCNGYFLDWASRDSHIVDFGRYAPLFAAFDLEVEDAPEAIGLKPSGRLSAFVLAQAYRVLAEADPRLIDRLKENVRAGTLARLGFDTLEVATKTGTVRDSRSRPRVGWVVLIDDDLIVVMARAAQAPREFFSETVALWKRHRGAHPAVRTTIAPGVTTCGSGGLGVTIVGEKIRVEPSATDGTFLCLGARTSRGAGVVQGAELRTTARAP